LPISERLQSVDFKEFVVKLFYGISPEIKEKYELGWSLRDIAKELGVSKNGIRSILLKAAFSKCTEYVDIIRYNGIYLIMI